jgi:hypothetical protein
VKHIHENIFDPELCLYDMVSSRTAMKYGEIKPGDWERRRKEKEEKRRHTAELFKRRLITTTSVGGLSLLVLLFFKMLKRS